MGRQQDRKKREALQIVNAGSKAFYEGKTRDACPYHSRVELRQLWIRGFENAAAGHGIVRSTFNF